MCICVCAVWITLSDLNFKKMMMKNSLYDVVVSRVQKNKTK